MLVSNILWSPYSCLFFASYFLLLLSQFTCIVIRQLKLGKSKFFNMVYDFYEKKSSDEPLTVQGYVRKNTKIFPKNKNTTDMVHGGLKPDVYKFDNELRSIFKKISALPFDLEIGQM